MFIFLFNLSNGFESPTRKTATLRGSVNSGVGSFKWFFCSFFRIGFAHPRVVTPNTSSASLRSYVYFSWLSFQTSLKLPQKKTATLRSSCGVCSGEGIRTPVRFSPQHAFQACALSRSATPLLFFKK